MLINFNFHKTLFWFCLTLSKHHYFIVHHLWMCIYVFFNWTYYYNKIVPLCTALWQHQFILCIVTSSSLLNRFYINDCTCYVTFSVTMGTLGPKAYCVSLPYFLAIDCQLWFLTMELENKYFIKWLSFIILRKIPEDTKNKFRLLEKSSKKLNKTQCHLVFNETCVRNELLPKHTNIYIYVYMYLYIFIHI